jgi:hypothetical protein
MEGMFFSGSRILTAVRETVIAERRVQKMKMSSQALRKRVNRHLSSPTIVAALGAVLDAQATSTSLDPALRIRIDEVLDALGLAGLPDGVSAADVRQILAEIRFNMLLDAKLFFHPTSPLAWTHTENEILQAGGEVSAGFADALTLTIVPRLDGLSQRLGVARWVVSRCWCGRGSDPVTAALVRLRTVLWGGCLIAPEQAETLLRETGFVDVRPLPSPPGAIVAVIAARRTPNQ